MTSLRLGDVKSGNNSLPGGTNLLQTPINSQLGIHVMANSQEMMQVINNQTVFKMHNWNQSHTPMDKSYYDNDTVLIFFYQTPYIVHTYAA